MSTKTLLFDEDVEMGENSIKNDFLYKNNVINASITVRLAFLRKVYSLLMIQLLATTLVGFSFIFSPMIRLYIYNNDWLISLSFILSVAILLALHVKRKHHPVNLILLAAFTTVQAFSVGVLVTFFEKIAVLQALLLTLVVVTCLTAFTFQSQRDFSTLQLGLMAGLVILILGGFLQIVFANTFLEIALSIGGAVLFSLFIIYDTQLLMKTLSPEEYILATINLYLDIINLFIHILRIIGASRR